MSADLITILLQFQPEAEELKQRQKYDQAARNFVSQLNNISQPHWLKGADTPEDVLEVRYTTKPQRLTYRPRFSTRRSTQ